MTASIQAPPATTTFPSELLRWNSIIDHALRASVATSSPLLREMTEHHMGWSAGSGAGGKHVRPNLCCWAAAACGGDVTEALPAACALELAHNFTLIHDDVQDRDALRRGRPTLWAQWGEAQAINAGDLLFALSMRALIGRREDERHRQAGALLLNTMVELVEGQCLDLESERRPQTAPGVYLRMAERKTGALLGASLAMGAVMAGASPDVERRLDRAGRDAGVAFQLHDDWLGAWGDTAVTGKAGHSDVTRRKLTYPVVAAYVAGDDATRRELIALYAGDDPSDDPRILALLGELGGAEATRAAARSHAAAALAQLRGCGFATEVENQFAEFVAYAIERDH